MTRTRLEIIAAVGVAGLAFALYVVTLAPTVTLVDSGELIAATTLLDIAHPPGMPFYVLLGHLFSLVPWGTPAVRLNLMSAVFGALACGAVFLLALQALSLAPSPRPARHGAKRGKLTKVAQTAGPIAISALPPALVAALCLACSMTLWSYSTIAEVYTLNTFLIALALLFATRAVWAAEDGGGKRDFRLAFIFFGLALATHHVTALFLAPGILFLLWTERRGAIARRGVAGLVWTLPGLALYVYLPLRAAQSPPLNWGNPSTLERFFWHITGKQYQSNFTFDWADLSSRAWFALKLLASEFAIVGLALAILGLLALAARNRRLFVFMLIVICANLACVLVYDITDDNEAYALPMIVLLAVALALGMRRALELARRGRKAATVGLALVPLACLFLHFRQNDERTNWVARDYALNVLENTAPGSVLLTMDWQLYSPLLYLQGVEKQRPDVLALDVNLLRRSWYVERLKRVEPKLAAAASVEMEIYLEQLSLFEHGRPYSSEVIQRAFEAFVNRIVDTAFQSRSVFVTVDLSAEPQMAAGYFRVPKGPVFRLFRSKPASAEDAGTFRLDCLRQARFDSDPVVKRVRRNYALMLLNRGIYLTLYGRGQEALDWRRRALELDPETPEAVH
jgi:hypothetical protein